MCDVKCEECLFTDKEHDATCKFCAEYQRKLVLRKYDEVNKNTVCREPAQSV